MVAPLFLTRRALHVWRTFVLIRTSRDLQSWPSVPMLNLRTTLPSHLKEGPEGPRVCTELTGQINSFKKKKHKKYTQINHLWPRRALRGYDCLNRTESNKPRHLGMREWFCQRGLPRHQKEHLKHVWSPLAFAYVGVVWSGYWRVPRRWTQNHVGPAGKQRLRSQLIYHVPETL